jgi:hypothetical protein
MKSQKNRVFQVDRLLALADYMEKVNDENYRQHSWVRPDSDEPSKLGRVVHVNPDGTRLYEVSFPEGFCNSVALMPGSKLKVAKEKGGYGYDIVLPRPKRKSLKGFAAAEEYFGISSADAQMLFGYPDGSTSAFYRHHGGFNTKSVARALRAYVLDPKGESDRAYALAHRY